MFSSLLSLIACWQTPDLRATGSFDHGESTQSIKLLHEPMVVSLPTASSLPKDSAYPIVDLRLVKQGASRSYYEAPWPGPLNPRVRRYQVSDFELQVNGAPLLHQRIHPESIGWTLVDDRLELVVEAPLSEQALVLYDREAQRSDQRRRPPEDPRDAEGFVHLNHTQGERSTDGLMLLSGASVEWSLSLQDGAHFRASLIPLNPQARLADLALVLVDPQGVETSYRPSHGWPLTREARDWTLDLSAYAGPVHLRFTNKAEGGDWLIGHPSLITRPSKQPRTVVVIGMDTTRADHLQTAGYDRATSPNLLDFSEQATVFTTAFSPAPRTRPAFRTSFTGREPLGAVGAPSFGEVFQAGGFSTGGVVANIHLNERFGFNAGFDTWRLRSSASASDQVDEALRWLTERPDEDVLLFLHLMDPHLFYAAPAPYDQRFTAPSSSTLPEPTFNRWTVDEWTKSGQLGSTEKQEIIDRYDGEIAYMDAELGRFLRQLDALRPNNLVVLHSDHGEELWDHGGFEHNHTLYNELVRVALWVRPPPGLTRVASVDEPVWLADIAPTLYDYAGLTAPPSLDGISLRPSVEGRGSQAPRTLPIGHRMYGAEQWGVIRWPYKWTIDTQTGLEHVYNLVEDPEEKAPLRVRPAGLDASTLSSAHPFQAGPGWRIDVDLDDDDFTIELPAPAVEVGVIDPESARVHRANLAWGERPLFVRSDVAALTLNDDRTRLTVSPGDLGRGTLFVRFSHDVPIAGQARWASGPPVRFDERQPTLRLNTNALHFSSGVVWSNPPTEAERMRRPKTTDAQSRCELCALGYLFGPGCAPCLR